jgi:hypothetical protein
MNIIPLEILSHYEYYNSLCPKENMGKGTPENGENIDNEITGKRKSQSYTIIFTNLNK